MEIGMNMSLDDYIKKATEMNMFKSNSSFANSERKCDATSKRSEEREDNDADDDILMIEDEDSADKIIWKGPSSKINLLKFDSNSSTGNRNNEQTSDESFDLREKLVKPNELRQPNLKSQNWRLMKPNVSCQRPPGMPPLVPGNAALSRISNLNGRFMGNNKQNNIGRHYRNRGGQRKNSFRHIKNSNFEGTSFHLTIPKMNGGNTSNSGLFNNNNSRNQSNIMALNGMNNFEMPSTSQSNQTKNLQDLFGLGSQDMNTAMMPQIASKVLDMIRGVTEPPTHKPLYDMNIHKEISEIQKKPFIYKCGGAQVISSDGPGINNVNITPSATPMSMNYRFA